MGMRQPDGYGVRCAHCQRGFSFTASAVRVTYSGRDQVLLGYAFSVACPHCEESSVITNDVETCKQIMDEKLYYGV